MLPELDLDDVVRLRKSHPCGSYEWKIIRLGADIGLECLGCQRRVLLPRRKLARRLKPLLRVRKTLKGKNTMKLPRFSKILAVGVFFLCSYTLVGCNMPRIKNSPPKLDVTQAQQTVAARLTQAIELTPTQDSASQAQKLTPSSTIDATPVSNPTSTPTENPAGTDDVEVPTAGCDQAAASLPKIDISIEDNTEMVPGEAFTKIWRVVNVGTCSWTIDYDVVFFSGELMDASASLPLSGVVSPNESVDISVNMVAPQELGTYQGNWKLRNGDGTLFGIGPGSESPFWVRIKVVSTETETATPAPTLMPTTEVQASGAASLSLNDNLDLDTVLVNVGGPDLKYRTTLIDPRYQLVPLVGVTMSVFGSTQPGMMDCKAANLAASPIILNELTTGTYLCHHTDLGLPGWVRFDGFDSDTGAIALQVLTWKLP